MQVSVRDEGQAERLEGDNKRERVTMQILRQDDQPYQIGRDVGHQREIQGSGYEREQTGRHS